MVVLTDTIDSVWSLSFLVFHGVVEFSVVCDGAAPRLRRFYFPIQQTAFEIFYEGFFEDIDGSDGNVAIHRFRF